MSNLSCPCGSEHYIECCQPLHLGQKKAQSAAQLMRSRYSAFAKHEIDYIVKTTALGQQHILNIKAIADWSKANQWLKLEIVQAQEKLDKNHALVEFKAYYADKDNNAQHVQIHHEISHFVFHENEWYFLDPTTDQQITMKQPCICGSTKKFKQCCAQFL